VSTLAVGVLAAVPNVPLPHAPPPLTTAVDAAETLGAVDATDAVAAARVWPAPEPDDLVAVRAAVRWDVPVSTGSDDPAHAATAPPLPEPEPEPEPTPEPDPTPEPEPEPEPTAEPEPRPESAPAAAPKPARAPEPAPKPAPRPDPEPEPEPRPDPPASGVSAQPGMAATTADLIGGTRANAGVRALQRDGRADAVAQAWAEVMASDGQLRHNPNYAQQLRSAMGSGAVAENVGMVAPADVQRLHRIFLDSSGHRANIVGDFTHLGVGAATDSSGRLWVVHTFIRLG
jgi:uncharacterized protein YkwD